MHGFTFHRATSIEQGRARERRRGCGGAGLRERWNAGTSAAGALDADWTLWMWQNRAPRLAVNAYIRCLISSRDLKALCDTSGQQTWRACVRGGHTIIPIS
jgi:hypothetical protein